ncbi:MAG: hypothetical protein O7F16_08735 [Acidobacteria bacterium]|nr:hypothetical protein [Acidobacteriota bacterium]
MQSTVGTGPRTCLAVGHTLLLVASMAVLCTGCSSRRQADISQAEPGPHDLVRRSSTHLRSKTLDVSLRYHEGGDKKFPFVLLRLKNLTKAPIYASLDQITLRRPGEADQTLRPACDRDNTTVARLAPREAHWCGKYANPGHSIDLPLALFEIPPPEGVLEFDVVLPMVFDTGDPIPVIFSNRVDRGNWRISPPRPWPLP